MRDVYYRAKVLNHTIVGKWMDGRASSIDLTLDRARAIGRDSTQKGESYVNKKGSTSGTK